MSRKVLIIADQTAVGSHIAERMQHIVDVDPHTSFHLLAPFSPPEGVDHDEALNASVSRCERAVSDLTGNGFDIEGRVGHGSPMVAVRQACQRVRPDLIVLSTLPEGVSRWLKMDLAHRIERKTGCPVEVIHAASAAPGPAGEAVKPAAETSESSVTSAALRVLLVEDNPEDAELTRLAIEKSNIRTDLRTASNGASALEYLRSVGTGRIDLVILDLKMPVLDGFGFLEEAAAEFDLSELDVVILTTSTHESDRDRAHKLGVAAYMVKDPDFIQFGDSIVGLLEEVAG